MSTFYIFYIYLYTLIQFIFTPVYKIYLVCVFNNVFIIFMCIEIDECVTHTPRCLNGGTCVDLVADWKCACPDDRWRGRRCEIGTYIISIRFRCDIRYTVVFDKCLPIHHISNANSVLIFIV